MGQDFRDPQVEEPLGEHAPPSKALAGIAAIVPFALTMSCCVGVPLSAGSGAGLSEFVQSMGVSFWLISLAALVAPIVAGVLLFIAGLGKPVPSFVTIGVACLPWLIGIAGARYGMYVAQQAITAVEPSMRASLLAAAVAESSTAHLYGATLSVGALVGVALGLALCALGQRAEERKLVAAVLALSTLPILAAAAWLFSVWTVHGPLSPLGVALSSLVVTGLAAAAVGRDAPRHRSGALGVAAVATVGLAFVAASSAGTTSAMIEVFQAIAFAAPDDRTALLAASAAELWPYRVVATYGISFSILPLLVMIGWAVTRAAPSAGRVLGGAAVAAVVLLLPLLDAAALRGGANAMAESTRPPWAGVEGFEPVIVEGVATGPSARAFLMPAGLLPMDASTPIGWGEAETLRAHIATLPAPPDFRYEAPNDPGVRSTRELPVAVDHRLEGAAFEQFLRSAAEAGMHRISVTGRASESASQEEVEAIRDALPMLAFIGAELGSVTLYLPGAVAPADMLGEPRLLHGVVGPLPEVSLAPLSGTGDVVTIDAMTPTDYERGVAYLELGPDVSAASYLLAASRTERAGFVVVAALEGVPATPNRVENVLGALGDAIGHSALEEILGQLEGAGVGVGVGVDPAPTDPDWARGIRADGEGRYLISREAAEQADSSWMRTARIIPHFEDGRPTGLRLFAIRPDSLFAHLGFQNGDTLRSVNGTPISDIDSSLRAYEGASAGDDIVVVFDRRGTAITQTYRIVDRLP